MSLSGRNAGVDRLLEHILCGRGCAASRAVPGNIVYSRLRRWFRMLVEYAARDGPSFFDSSTLASWNEQHLGLAFWRMNGVDVQTVAE